MPEQPLPLDLVDTKDLVDELQARFDIFLAAGVRYKQPGDMDMQFGVKGNVLDIVSLVEYLKTELILRTLEDNQENGNGSRDFD
tara:strand:- start:2293 stop:2544 length:252 start_codon:yes stop_codon:yes gene_type:complete